jgi:hypothetical protein
LIWWYVIAEIARLTREVDRKLEEQNGGTAS